MVVLAVIYAMDTPVTLISDVGRTLVQLELSVCIGIVIKIRNIQVQILSGETTRNRRQHRQSHAQKQQDLAVDQLNSPSADQRYHKSTGAHGQEAQRCLTSRQVVDFLSHEDKVVEDGLVASIDSWYS